MNKSPVIRSKAIRNSAREGICEFRFNGCEHTGTVVWCHYRSIASGAGMGLKPSDLFGAYGCNACHALMDGRIPGLSEAEKAQAWLTAMVRSQRRLVELGIVKVL